MSVRNLLNYFQNREDAIAAFDSLWGEDEHRWILAFKGFSGLGKSTLLEWLELNRCKVNGIPYSKVDFSTAREYKDILDGILRHNGLKPHIPQKAYHEYETKRDSILADRDSQVNLIVIDQQQLEGDGNRQEAHLDLAEVKRQRDRHSRSRLTDAWLSCLGQIKRQRLVIFLDTFENFQDITSHDDADWFYMLLEEAKKVLPGLRVVIGSQQPFNAIKRYVIQWELKAFTAEHSRELLTNLGVTDIDFGKAVYEKLAKGHPLVTTFAAEAWLEAQHIGNPLMANEIPKIGELEEAVRWIQDVILYRLQEPFRSAVRWAALLRGFNLEIINEMFNLSLSGDDFQKLTSYSFIERDPGLFGWKCHDLLRNVQSDYLSVEQPQTVSDFHRRAAQYFETKGLDVEHLYHRFFYEPDQAFELWIKKINDQQSKFDFNEAERLFEILENTGFGLKNLQRAAYLHVRGLHYYYLSERQRAEQFFMESKQLYEGANHNLGTANLLESLGDIERARNNLDAARIYYQQARDKLQTNQSSLGRVHHCIGLVELLTGNPKAARENYDLALGLIDSTHNPNDYANLLSSLGNLNFIHGNAAIAEKQYKQAQELYARANNRRGQASTLRQLAEIIAKKGEVNAAKQALQTAISISKSTSDMSGTAYSYLTYGDISLDSRLLFGLENLQELRQEALDSYIKALELFQQIGDQRGEAIAYHALGSLFITTGQFDQAREHLLLSLSMQDNAVVPLDQLNTYIHLIQVESHLNNPEQAKIYYTKAMEITEKADIQYTPAGLELRHNFWSMTFKIDEELYLLLVRVLDWILKTNMEESRQCIHQMQEDLFSSEAEKVINLMLGFGPDRELLSYHLSLLQNCRKEGIESAYSHLPYSIWHTIS